MKDVADDFARDFQNFLKGVGMKHKRCPFCHASEEHLESIFLVERRHDRDIVIGRFVSCKVCKCQGPRVDTDHDPFLSWDLRVKK
jgi:hypothetical protein